MALMQSVLTDSNYRCFLTYSQAHLICVTCSTFEPLPINGRSCKEKLVDMFPLVYSTCIQTQVAIIWVWTAIILRLWKVTSQVLQSQMCHHEKLMDGRQVRVWCAFFFFFFFKVHPPSFYSRKHHSSSDGYINPLIQILVSALTKK